MAFHPWNKAGLVALRSQKVKTVSQPHGRPLPFSDSLGRWGKAFLSLCLRLQSTVGPSHPHCGTSLEVLLFLEPGGESRAPQLAGSTISGLVLNSGSSFAPGAWDSPHVASFISPESLDSSLHSESHIRSLCTQTLLQMRFEPEGTGQVSNVVVRTTCKGLLGELVTTLLPGHLSSDLNLGDPKHGESPAEASGTPGRCQPVHSISS